MRRYAASGTAFVRRFREDPFFRTEVAVIGMQGAFAAVIFAIVAITASVLYRDASSAIIKGIADTLVHHAPPEAVSTAVVAELDYLRSRTVILAASAILVATAAFSYVIARIALRPTQNALTSQKQFIGNVAHEIRTPLSVIRTNTEVLLMTTRVSDEVRGMLESTIEELERMSEIINNLLSLSASIRPEKMEFTTISLEAPVREAVRSLQHFAESKGIRLDVTVSGRSFVLGNVTALEQVATNIIKNALLYTPQGGRVRIVVEPVHPEHILFSVSDNGQGIPHQDLPHIFEPYYRAERSRNRKDGGGGLGLAIVSELVRLHQGRISVQSAEGRGTTVITMLPAAPDTGPGGARTAKRSEVTMDFLSGS